MRHMSLTLDRCFPETRERIARWRNDPDVLAVLQVGSKTRGFDDATSDDDLEVVLTEAAAARIPPGRCIDRLVVGEGAARRVVFDAQLAGPQEYVRKLDSPFDLDHWPYEAAIVHFDRDGRVAAWVRRLGEMPPEFRAARLRHAAIDAWIAPRRAARTVARGGDAAGRLLIVTGVRALTRVLFALEWRWAPLDHWWERDLATLADPHGAGPYLLEAMRTLDPKPLVAALARLDGALAAEGVPAAPEARVELFLTLVHASNAAERARHVTM
jgi:hypothetical protein